MRKNTLNVIAKGEVGTTGRSGYDVTLGQDAYGPKNHKPITKMTMQELDAYQTAMLRDPKNKFNSSAVGRYQITRTTRRGLMKKLKIDNNAVYSPELQDTMANELLVEAGANRYQNGSITLPQYQNKISKIWQSMPNTAGQESIGLSAGKSTRVTQGELQEAIGVDKYQNTGQPTYNSAGQMVIDDNGKVVQGTTFTQPNTAFTAVQVQDPNASGTGIVSEREDGTSTGTVKQVITKDNELKSVFESPWAPRPNIFKQFATMTYNVSLYLSSPKMYQKMMTLGKKDVTGLTLFIQSAGANQQDNSAGNFKAKRSEFFKNDFYIDNIQFKSYISGASTLSMHNTTELNFTITEPAGLTFFENLLQMVKKEFPNHPNYAAQQYLMVIRFYGYDAEGNQIMGHELPDINSSSFTDNTAVGEKFIPFIFKGISFQLREDKVEYSCEAVCPNSHFANSQYEGTIPFNMNINGETLSDALTGVKAGSPGNYINVGGLASALNAHQKELVDKKIFNYANEYKIEFSKDIDAETMKILSGGDGTSRYLQSTTLKKDKGSNTLTAHGGSIKVNTDIRTINLSKGIKITKVIDFIMQTSEYVTKQYSSKTDPSSGTDYPSINGNVIKKEDLRWFKIETAAVPIADKWDSKRNDYVYEITYKIYMYKFTPNSVYMKKIQDGCFSVHKEYNYWFSGDNTEVLGFTQDFKYLYYNIISKPRITQQEAAEQINSNASNTVKIAYDTSSGAVEFAGTNGSDEISANIASELYSPGDMASAEIAIVGDPDFIAQSELFYSPIADDDLFLRTRPYMDDGSVNYNSTEVYFSINYNTVVDYDLDTGLADVTKKNVGMDQSSGQQGMTQYTFIYRLNTLTTQLVEGEFKQKLEGTMKVIAPKCTFAFNAKDSARRESPKQLSASSLSGTQNLNPGKSNPKKPMELPQPENEKIPKKPSFIPSDPNRLAFDGFENDRIKMDTPSPIHQVKGKEKTSWGTFSKINEPPFVSNITSVVNETITKGTEFVDNTYTNIILEPSKDLAAARKKIFDKINFSENNPLDGGNS